MKFLNIYKETEERMRLALLSLWAPGKHPMRPALEKLLKEEPLLAEPVFQSTFGWKNTQSEEWRNYLNQTIIKKLKIGAEYKPYTHQAESWKTLKEGKSIVVTSGTGSGKTECFMYPVISDLFEQERDNSIQAIFLYPLNALMEDQKKRLSDYCGAAGLKFAVYNGDTGEFPPTAPQDLMPNEVGTRKEIRDKEHAGKRPQILLTNPSMLEYIMVRQSDQQMIQESAGRLRWIVIDEAHTYSGSAAVELAYQIKRILDAFKVKAENVRFACTSATIGGESGKEALAQFIATITGQDVTQIKVIGGSREIPDLDTETLDAQLKAKNLPSVEKVMVLRERINTMSGMSLHDMWTNLMGSGGDNNIEDALTLLDNLCELKQNGKAVLSLRAHFFMRSISGLYGCANENCKGTSGTPYGHLTTYKGSVCSQCGSPLLEIVQCKRCNSFILMGTSDSQTAKITPYDDTYNQADYFTIDNSEADEDADEPDLVGNSDTFFLLPYEKESFSNPYGQAHAGFNKIAHSTLGSKLIPDLEEAGLTEYKGVMAKDVALNTTWVDLQKDTKSYCPSCGKLARGKQLNFKHFRIPINFINQTIAPVFLKECAQGEHSWGKYIAFTDSRQGTAISAKSFNINVERMRGWEESIKLLVERQRSSSKRMISLEKINKLLEENQSSSSNTIDLEDFRARVAALMMNQGQDGDGSATLNEIANAIFDDTLFSHITKEDRSPNKEAYKASLIRGIIGRRPAFELSVEALGLLTLEYPKLKEIKAPASLMDYADRHGLTIENKDWQDYLKIVLDYFVRMGNHIQPLIPEERKYIRDANLSTPFAGPDDDRKSCSHWPKLRKKADGTVEAKQSRTILALCAGLGIHTLGDLQTNARIIDNIIRDAWNALVDSRLLTRVKADDRDGYNDPRSYGDERYVGCYYLDLSNRESNKTAILRLTPKVFICPVTGGKLDTTFMGYSPLLTGELSEKMFAKYKCVETIEMPVRPNEDEDVADWLQHDDKVAKLQNEGLWGDRYGDIYGCKPTYLAAEHSAQQSKKRLCQYTEEFSQKNPTINVLQCSTTMEMGVDIGDIDIVLMNTIPPTAANYLQRVGRAGRMGQSKAIAFSFCNNTPVGQYAFANPMWALQTTNHMIKVRESDTIIQRHINSYFFRKFICENGLGIQTTMTVDDFMTNSCDGFVDYLDTISTNNAVETEFHKTFGSHRFTIDVTRKQMMAIKEKYNEIIRELEDALETFRDDERRRQAISLQVYRCQQEKLLRYLSEHQFIPNANMPTDVVTFNFMDEDQSGKLQKLYSNREQYKAKKESAKSEAERIRINRDLNSVQSEISELNKATSASRDIRTALNEYAPEQTVVVNEKNFVSAGITLFGAYNEATHSKAIYHCENCGRIEYSNNLDENKVCTHCGTKYRNIIDSNAKSAYTRAYEPVGFRTDQNANASRKEKTEKKFYDIRPLLLDVNWSEKHKVNLCDVVSSGEKGKILFYNMGIGKGFAFCKRCGRAAVEDQYERSVPFAVRPGHHHLWLEGKDSCCEANDNDIARNVVFTGMHYTCYSVLRFYADAQNFENDEQLAYSMGVVLTRALAKSEGIDEGEVGFGVKQEENAWLVFIYDTAKGGCGYSLKFADPAACQDIFDIARTDLENSPCKCHEDGGACTSCLVDRNNYRFANKLSKAKALDWLNKQKNKINKVPAEVLTTCPNAKIAYQTLKSAFSQACKNSDVTDITVVVSDNNSDIVVSNWVSQRSEMGKNIRRAIEHGIKVQLLVEYHPDFHEDGDKLKFVGLKDKFPDCRVEFIKDLGDIKTALHVKTSNDERRYYVEGGDALAFSNNWGETAAQVYTDKEGFVFEPQAEPTYTYSPTEIVRQGVANTARFHINNYFSKVIGESLLKDGDDQLLHELLEGSDVEITFSDMYVNSALASLMFTYLVKEMQEIYGFTISNIVLQLDSQRRKCENTRFNEYYTPISWNWQTKEEADNYTESLIKDVLEVDPEFSPYEADHHRWVRLTTSRGATIEIRPDHGISGGWGCYEKYMNIDYVDGQTTVFRTDEDVVFYFIIKKANR